MSEDINVNYVNKYVNVVKTRHDKLMSDLISMEVNYAMIKESLDEHHALVQQQNEKIAELEAKLSKKTSRSTTSKPKEESF